MSICEFESRAGELAELLGYCRDLSDILSADELFVTIAGIIEGKFKIRELGLFTYEPQKRFFSLVFSNGLGQSDYKLRADSRVLWHSILRARPFEVVDDSGNPRFAGFPDKQDLDTLPSKLWVPLVMRSEVMGLLALGAKNGNQAFDNFDHYFLQQIAAQASVSINTCRLYERRRQEKEDLDKTLQNLPLLYGIGKAMNYISDLKKLLHYILNQAIDIASAEKGSLMLYDLETN